ncbi:hypothetical protein D6827_00360 [Candidatus Parcubacteria bacterium]|nr:MAG: hypothetical protein D6827_00360 [Candidatus Parcubacteria bacterium]
MDILSKIRSIAKSDEFDEPSREIAKRLEKEILNEAAIRELLNTQGFKLVLAQLENAFISRLEKIVENDPELRTIKAIFTMTLGAKGAEEKAYNIFQEFINN